MCCVVIDKHFIVSTENVIEIQQRGLYLISIKQQKSVLFEIRGGTTDTH